MHSDFFADQSTLDSPSLEGLAAVCEGAGRFPEVCRHALVFLGSTLGWQRSMVVLDDGSGSLRCVDAIGMSPEQRLRAEYGLGEGVIGQVFATGMPAVIPDVCREPGFLNRCGAIEFAQGRPLAFLAAPIRVDRLHIGVLTLARPAPSDVVCLQADLTTLRHAAAVIGQWCSANGAPQVVRAPAFPSATPAPLQRAVRQAVLSDVVAQSPQMQEVLERVAKVSNLRTTVLLRGESGSGKEVLAKAIHQLSPRRTGPFIAFNCAALADSLLETELFGHERGAFTGATSLRKGRFELAQGGTLFLDEIGDISPACQCKLLRVLQEREFERVGATHPIKLDVRFIFATNRDLERMVEEGRFRADLYYRINVVGIQIPPLRERPADIAPIVHRFLKRLNAENDRCVSIQEDALRVLRQCYWRGNVRELENCVERAVSLLDGEVLTPSCFDCCRGCCASQALHRDGSESVNGPVVAHEDLLIATEKSGGKQTPRILSREHLVHALKQTGWSQAKAARLLGVTYRQVAYAVEKHKIDVKRF